MQAGTEAETQNAGKTFEEFVKMREGLRARIVRTVRSLSFTRNGQRLVELLLKAFTVV